MLVGITKVFIL